jgi:hypothetical protein
MLTCRSGQNARRTGARQARTTRFQAQGGVEVRSSSGEVATLPLATGLMDAVWLDDATLATTNRSRELALWRWQRNALPPFAAHDGASFDGAWMLKASDVFPDPIWNELDGQIAADRCSGEVDRLASDEALAVRGSPGRRRLQLRGALGHRTGSSRPLRERNTRQSSPRRLLLSGRKLTARSWRRPNGALSGRRAGIAHHRPGECRTADGTRASGRSLRGLRSGQLAKPRDFS